MRRIATIIAGLAIAGTLPGAAVAITDGEKCEADKLKAAGQYAFCRMKAESKAIKNSEAPDYSKCDTKYAEKWAKVESKAGGSCPVTGDADVVQARTTVSSDGLAAAIGGGPRFVDNADGTITDNFTGLMWEKKTELNGAPNFANLNDADNFHPWSGTCTAAPAKRCQPSAAATALCVANVDGNPGGCPQCGVVEGECDEEFTVWNNVASLNSANFAGHDDWRVPTIGEFYSIVDYGKDSPTVADAFAGASCGAACMDLTSAACSCTDGSGYWSATTHAPAPGNAWYVTFSEGWAGYDSKDGVSLAVRAVRGGW